jgi:hypothetical protein
MTHSKVRLYINHKPAQLISSVVNKNGARAIDTGIFSVTRKTAVTKGDTFQYLQDVVSSKNLVGLWNMEYNTRDESGYDIDGDETTANIHQGDFVAKAGGYAYKNGNTGRCIKIAHDPHLDFSQQFDIIILGGLYNGYPHSQLGYMIGKGSSTNSIELSTISGSSNSVPMYLKLDIKVGGVLTTITGTTDINKTNVTHNADDMIHFWWIRIKRDENNLISLMLEDNVEGTSTISGDFGTSDPLYIAGDRSGSNILDNTQHTAQVRIYSGGYLTDDEWDTLRSAKRSTEIMKFGGTVWKIEEKPAYKRCYCKGLADKIHNVEIQGEDGVNPDWTTTDTDIIRNTYYDKTGKEILTDLIKAYDLGINLAVIGSNINETYSQYVAVGTLFTNVFLLTLNGGNSESFHITPRGTLMMEDDDVNHQKILFKQGSNIRIHDFGYDDSNTITELTLLSANRALTKIKETLALAWDSDPSTSGDQYVLVSGEGYKQYVNKLSGKPLSAKVTDPNGTVLTSVNESLGVKPWERTSTAAGTGEFKIDYWNKGIYLGDTPFYSSPSVPYKIEYTYDDLSSNRFYTSQHSTYTTLGSYSKTMNIPQFMGQTSLANLAARIFAKLGDVERRITITVPTLVNHIRENYEIKIEDPIHGVGTAGSPVVLSVKSMEFHYPEGKTVINCGEHQFDSYDLDKSFGEAISTAKSVLVENP